MGHCERAYYWINCDEGDCNESTEDDAESRPEAEAKAKQQGFVHIEGHLWFCKKHAVEYIRKAENNMDKFGVQEDVPEDLEKKAAEGCPVCGKKPVVHGNVLMCPDHGSEPWETKEKA
jgi:hypothetical protein